LLFAFSLTALAVTESEVQAQVGLRAAFQSSQNKGGAYANDVIGAVAKGNISQTGSITGDKAATALQSYMYLGGIPDAPRLLFC
jgi:hypothetical protein